MLNAAASNWLVKYPRTGYWCDLSLLIVWYLCDVSFHTAGYWCGLSFLVQFYIMFPVAIQTPLHKQRKSRRQNRSPPTPPHPPPNTWRFSRISTNLGYQMLLRRCSREFLISRIRSPSLANLNSNTGRWAFCRML